MSRPFRFASGFAVALMLTSIASAAEPPVPSFRYYRPGNTGIQGDYVESIFIGADGDPWIGGYQPSFEEGGLSKFVQAENRWINVSNVDYPVIGHPDLTGTSRVSDMVEDSAGRIWAATWRGALRFDPAVGPSSLVNFASQSTQLMNGGCRDLDIAPDGTVWFGLVGFGGSIGGMLRYTPTTGAWKFWTGGSVPIGGGNWPQLVWIVEHVAVQPKPSGGYRVWADSGNGASIVVFDSATQTWTNQEFDYVAGSMFDMPGKDSVDDAGNLWMIRFVQFAGSTAVYSLDYRKVDGTWVTPSQPPIPGGVSSLWAFRAFGDRQALAIDGNGRVWRFDGVSWSDLGVWRPGAFSYDVHIDTSGNVWACGTGGAAKRDAATGIWQRYRVTNTSQFDSFNDDLAVDPATGEVLACANAGPGVGGMVRFDGERWIGFNNDQYGLGVSWPFPTDNSRAVAFRPSLGSIVVNPTYNGIRSFSGTAWSNLNGSSESRGLVEDSLGRLWSLGNYFELKVLSGPTWTSVPNNGNWGNNIELDPDRPGTVWVSTYAEIIRTDGVYRFSKTYGQFPELNTQSDIFKTVAPEHDGVAWFGSTKGMFRIDANTGAYQYFTSVDGISCLGASPLATTSDGRVWFTMFDSYGSGPHGLVWFDGMNSGIFSAPKNGGPQWGGLPHAQIGAIRVREIDGGYELWMNCASRGIAVLTVPEIWTDLGLGKPGVHGVPQLRGVGPLSQGSSGRIDLSAAAPGASAYLVVGLTPANQPIYGGTLVPNPVLITQLSISAGGTASVPFTWPTSVAPGTEIYLQCWIPDGAASFGYAASNGLRGISN